MLTGRVVGLRPVLETDLEFLAELANHPLVRGNVVGWDWPVATDSQSDWLKAANRNPTTRRLTVTVAGEPVGLTGLWDVDRHNRSALTAVKLMPGRAPKGAGSDSIMLTMAWAYYEVGLHRLHSTILAFNQASLGAYVRRCGWVVEGREREAVFRGGTWHDLIRVAALRTDFDAHPDAAEYVQRLGIPAATAPTAAPAPGVPAMPAGPAVPAGADAVPASRTSS